MAIFGRSKKGKDPKTTTTTTTTAALPLTHTAPILNQQANASNFCTTSPVQVWSNGNLRPQTAGGYDPQQPQGWLVAPLYQQPQISQSQLQFAPLPLPPRHPKKERALGNLHSASVTNLLYRGVPSCFPGAQFWNDEVHALYNRRAQFSDEPLPNLILTKLNTVITLIDEENFSGEESELAVCQPPPPAWQQEQQAADHSEKALSKSKSKGVVNKNVSTALVRTNYFAKVNLYANSRLPPNLPPLKLYMPTYPLLCLAAQYSERVYTKPSGKEKETHVEAQAQKGTKAMVIKSVPMDDINTIVFAVRGTQTFMDWVVNLQSAPASPEGFLDDPGNLCHSGFLTTAKKMIKPVAARLRHLLEEDPNRSSYSLLITGHSAGGAVAALLYSHMLCTSPETTSELNILTGCFKRIHCISFGAPPVSLLPLARPSDPRYRKSLFLSFVNEGDPVPRADKPYVRSLLDLYSTPAPGQSCLESVTPQKLQPLLGKKSSSSLTINKIRPTLQKSSSAPPGPQPYWRVPEATLSNAGRLVLLRSVEKFESRRDRKKHVQERMDEGVVAQVVTDELLRGVIWGDPVCHMMKLYARRIEILATNAVTGRS